MISRFCCRSHTTAQVVWCRDISWVGGLRGISATIRMEGVSFSAVKATKVVWLYILGSQERKDIAKHGDCGIRNASSIQSKFKWGFKIFVRAIPNLSDPEVCGPKAPSPDLGPPALSARTEAWLLSAAQSAGYSPLCFLLALPLTALPTFVPTTQSSGLFSVYLFTHSSEVRVVVTSLSRRTTLHCRYFARIQHCKHSFFREVKIVV